MAKRRRFTAKFKAEVVLEALTGDSSEAKLCRRHNLSEQQLSKWKQQAIENFASLFGSKDKSAADDAARIAHLEIFDSLTLNFQSMKKSKNHVSAL